MFRRLMFLNLALAGFCLLNPGSGLAQFHNQIGLYADPGDLTSTSLTVASAQPVVLYLVLSSPYLEGPGHAPEGVSAFECRVGAPLGDEILGFTPEGQAVNLSSYPEIIVGYGTPLAVVGGQVLLGTLLVQTEAAPSSFYFLEKIFLESLEGTMAYVARVGEDEEMVPMFPASGNQASPVFAINGTVVDAASETWGGVKSLYR